MKEKRSRKELKFNKKEVVKNGKRKVVFDFYKIRLDRGCKFRKFKVK